MSNTDPNSFAPSLPTRGGTAANGKASYSSIAAATQLLQSNGGWSAIGTAATVTYAFRVSGTPADSSTSGFSQFNTQQIAATTRALQAWSDVAAISFVRVNPTGYSNDASILFGNFTTGSSAGYGYYPGSTAASSLAGDVWINGSLSYNIAPTTGNYGGQTIVHEIGHAIGLSHPGSYDATDTTGPTYATSAQYFQDSRQYTVMSYFSESNTGGSYGGFYSAAPLLDDITAAQRLYGANTATRATDTVYGFNSNTGREWYSATGSNSSLVFAAWDGGGTDTFDFSGYGVSQLIDLREGAFSNVGGLTGNVAIAYGTVIENAIGGSGVDVMIGNAANNVLTGGAGNDFLYGEGGNDTLIGGLGDDTLDGGSGTNVIDGGDGNDTLLLAGAIADYSAVRNANGSWTIAGNGVTDIVSNVEQVSIGAVTATTRASYSFGAFTNATFDALRYTASYGDLIRAFGTDTAAARNHYLTIGQAEGRVPTFDPYEYGASNPDLARAFGADATALETHYIRYGLTESRPTTSFNALLYGASNIDLARIIGDDLQSLEIHYLTNGLREGRALSGFDALRYAASNPDLYRAYGTNVTALTLHYLRSGADEGRSTTSFDALRYAASYADIGRAYGTNVAALTQHYLSYGISEGRNPNAFDPYAYAVANPDLVRALGVNTAALETHYIQYGRAEGRALGSFNASLYGASNVDLARVFGNNLEGLTQHYLTYGIAEHRATNSFDWLLYAASNPDLARIYHANPTALADQYLSSGLAAGRPVASFDALRYAASNTDLITAVGLDTRALASHYVVNGSTEGRSLVSFDPVAYLLSYTAAQNTGSAAAALNYYIQTGRFQTTNPDGKFGYEQTVSTIAVGQNVVASFETVGDRDWFRLTLTGSQTLTINLGGEGSQVDTYLYVHNAAGVKLAENDDISSTNVASRLTLTLGAGTYYIVAGTYADASSGNYHISVTAGSADIAETASATIDDTQFAHVASSVFSSADAADTGHGFQTVHHGFDEALVLAVA